MHLFYLSHWFHESPPHPFFLNLRMQSYLLMMTGCTEGGIRKSVGEVQILDLAQLLTRYPNLDRAKFNGNY